MKAKIASLSLLLIISGLYATELRNGDFESGSSGWRGDNKVVYETDEKLNKVCRMEADSDDQIFYQEIKTKKAKDLKLKFKVKKSIDYEGRGFSIRFVRDNGSYTFFDSSADSTEWKEKTINFSDINGSRSIKISVLARSADEGYLDFDDFVLTLE